MGLTPTLCLDAEPLFSGFIARPREMAATSAMPDGTDLGAVSSMVSVSARSVRTGEGRGKGKSELRVNYMNLVDRNMDDNDTESTEEEMAATAAAGQDRDLLSAIPQPILSSSSTITRKGGGGD